MKQQKECIVKIYDVIPNLSSMAFILLFNESYKSVTNLIDAIDFYIENPNKPKQPIVEFINYTGKYPNLCSGDLTLKINGIEYIFSSRYKNTLNIDLLPSFWAPGGKLERDSNGKYSIKEKGDWEFVNERLFKEEILKYKDEIMKVFNENVPKGCCGGCF